MDFKTWSQFNSDHLFARVEWLKGRLVEHIQSPSPSRKTLHDEPLSSHPLPLDSGDEGETDPTLTPSLVYLSKRFGLTRFESQVLLFCVAVELDTSLPRLCASAHKDPAQPWPTFELCFRLLDEPQWNALLPESPLRQFRLIEVRQERGLPVLSAALGADERIVNFARGLNHRDVRLAPLISPIEGQFDLDELPRSQAQLAETILQTLEASVAASHQFPIVQLVGSDSPSKQHIASAVAKELERPLYLLPAELIPSDILEQLELQHLWQRENALEPSVLYVDASEADGLALKPGCPLLRFCSTANALLLVDLAEAQSGLRRASEVFDIAKPTGEEQRDRWRSWLAPESNPFVNRLSGQFNLDFHSIDDIARKAAFQAGDASTEERDAVVWHFCRRHARPHLDRLAQRIDCRATFEDLVLPREQLNQLRDIVAQVEHRATVYHDWGFGGRMNRGLGISVLFAGESGTGKTMAAEVLAGALELDLYRIDLSQVIDKYVGEGAKRLKRLLDAGDDGSAILFFDEADALFGKRSEVKDSHDRYANQEVNYLLQRLESFKGLAILATNLKQSLDAAFLRRLRFVVDFPLPDATQRRELWRRAFPPETPTTDLDYDHLARLHLTGGHIHTIALNAAFRSAREAHEIQMPTLLSTAQKEYKKLQKPAPAAEFQWPLPQGVHS